MPRGGGAIDSCGAIRGALEAGAASTAPVTAPLVAPPSLAAAAATRFFPALGAGVPSPGATPPGGSDGGPVPALAPESRQHQRPYLIGTGTCGAGGGAESALGAPRRALAP